MNTPPPYQTYLLDLLQQIEAGYGHPIEPRLREAFLDNPRHRFIPRYQHPITRQWVELNPQSLDEHLPTLYANRSLGIYQLGESSFIATISQPVLVLNMLFLLDIQPGMSVFEIGTGSGWNAALMSSLVGPQGHVYSAEILPDLVTSSQQALRESLTQSVTVLLGDGMAGYASGAPFDRIIFTAGAYDIPLALHQQLKEGGLLLAVLKIAGGGDDLVLLKKQDGILVSQYLAPVQFVPVLGSYRSEQRDGEPLSAFLEQVHLVPEPIDRMPFWWGSRLSWNMMERTEGIRSYLQLSEPDYRVFITDPASPAYCFGLYDGVTESLVVVQNDSLVSYGNLGARTRLLAALGQWVERGMPSSVRLRLRIHPQPFHVATVGQGWVVKQTDSVFVWEPVSDVE